MVGPTDRPSLLIARSSEASVDRLKGSGSGKSRSKHAEKRRTAEVRLKKAEEIWQSQPPEGLTSKALRGSETMAMPDSVEFKAAMRLANLS